MLILFGVTIFLSAALLFFVQPMVARMVLPLLGGTPAVWNTCMVFFQALLLGGYAYAHVLTKVKRPALQVAVHAVLCLLPLAFLPVALPANPEVPESSQPVAWLLGVLALTVGVPFFVLSATGPLLQRWFSMTDHPAAKDPYFLYAASNAGSLLALLGYPFVFERVLRLKEQSLAWSGAYVVLAGLLVGAGVMSLRRRTPVTTARRKEPAARGAPGAVTDPAAGVVTWQTKLLWVLLAFSPSSLMLGATNFISTDVAAVPLLWIVPLTIYLLTMILAYSRFGARMTRIAGRVAPIAVVALVMSILLEARRPISVIVALHMLSLLAGAMACHGRLAALRPGPEGLTGYFLWISVGGVLGGIFNALVSPLVFDTVVEYPVAIVLSSALALGLGVGSVEDLKGRRRWTGLALDIVIPGALTLGVLILAQIVNTRDWSPWIKNSLSLGLPALGCYLLVRWPMRFILGLAGLLGLSMLSPGAGGGGTTIYTGRTFYGVQRVTEIYQRTYESRTDQAAQPVPYFRQLLHGNTIHGRQCIVPGKETVPLTYYHPTGPLGQVFKALESEPQRVKNIAVVGLGTGSAAAYAKREQTITFYEIDPAIEALASNPDYFSYLVRSEARNVRIILGDGRRSLAHERSPLYDVLVLDAFSSDAIPIHLLTVEAFEVYLSRLADRGLILLHTSNRHMDLPQVAAGIASRLGMAGYGQNDSDPTYEEAWEGKFGSEWLVMARREEDLKVLGPTAKWLRMPTGPGAGPVWTDDFSSILDVLRVW